jgi:hypothetical protein
MSMQNQPSQRANALAERLEQGANALIAFASTLTDAEWKKPERPPQDPRPIGVVIHHVATVYPIEIHIAQVLASGKPITGVTMEGIAEMNAGHAKDNADVDKATTLDLLRRNSADAAAAIRKFSDAELDSAAPASIVYDAPVTCQFMLEDHAVRHSYHHLARIRAALGR